MITHTADKHDVSSLIERSAVVNGENIIYRFYCVDFDSDVIYAIMVKCGTDCEICLASREANKAEELFWLVVSGNVTPCTLSDIAEDFRKNWY